MLTVNVSLVYPLQKPRTFSTIRFVVILLFIAFAAVHWQKSVTSARHRLLEHARIVTDSVWNLNSRAATEYLKTVASHSNYAGMTIRDMEGRVFANAPVAKQSRIDRFLVSLHLIPKYLLTAPIIYKNKQIGTVEVIWLNRSIYLYFYTFIFITLLLCTIYLYLRMLDNKKYLEKEVRNRTRTLQESEQRFRAIFDNHYQLTGLVSPDGILISANQASLDLIDCKEEDIVGLPFSDCPWWGVGSSLHEDMKLAIQEAQAGDFVRREIHFKDFNGHARVVDYSLKPVFNENNELIYILPEGRDITVLKQTQEEILREKKFTDAVIESLPGIFYVCNQQMQLVRWNKMFEVISGYSPEELMHKQMLSFFTPDDGEIVMKRIAELKETSVSQPIELAALTKDGSRTSFLFSSSLIEIGGTVYLIGTGVDISDRKKIEAELQQAQKMEAIGTLAGGIAHDFNNILSAIIGYTELSQLEADRDSRINGFLAGIHQAAIRARDLVQQILTFSRKQDNSRLPLQIAPLLNEALRLIRSSIPSTINIETDIGAREAMILAEPTQIHRVFVNLCTNGYQAIGDENGTLTVTLEELSIDSRISLADTSLARGRYIKIAISDTGQGMDQETMKRIFEPYFTTRETGKGTGLGLALVDSIIREHNGAISVDSTPGSGTTFSVYLPVLCKKTEHPPEHLPQPAPIAVEGHYIVCVDDEPYILNILEEFLRESEFRVKTFTTGRDAIDYIDTTDAPVDLVITDMTMPNMTGLELGRRIFSSHPHLPVILCTGYSRTINREKALAEGFCRYIEKPVILADLLSAVQSVLTGKED